MSNLQPNVEMSLLQNGPEINEQRDVLPLEQQGEQNICMKILKNKVCWCIIVLSIVVVLLIKCFLPFVRIEITKPERLNKSKNGNYVIKESGNITLKCTSPLWFKRTWRKQNDIKFRDDSDSISFKNITAESSGRYTCEVNILGSDSVTLIVPDKLEKIRADVHVAPPGINTELCCYLNYPKEIQWFINETDRIISDKVVYNGVFISPTIIGNNSCLIFQFNANDKEANLNFFNAHSQNVYGCKILDQLLKFNKLLSTPKEPKFAGFVGNDTSHFNWTVFNSIFPVTSYEISTRLGFSTDWEPYYENKISNNETSFSIDANFPKLQKENEKLGKKLLEKNQTYTVSLTIVDGINSKTRCEEFRDLLLPIT